MDGRKYGGKSFDPPLDLINHFQRPGFAFYEVICSPSGSFDNTINQFSISLTLDCLQLRHAGQKNFEYQSLDPVIGMPGDTGRAEWKGMATSLILNISDNFIASTIRSDGNIARPNTSSHAGKIRHLMHLIRSDVNGGSLAGASVSEFFVAEIVAAVFGEVEPKRSGCKVGKQIIDQICEYIDDNLASPLPMIDLASRAGMSTRHMCRAFQLSTSVTPHAYIIRRRVERARHLILSADGMALREISAEVGFSSQAHMNWAFKKVLSRQPSHFRNIRAKKT